MNSWKQIDAEQLREAPPSNCRYCGGPIYWELLPRGKKRPVDATDFEMHYCNKRPNKEGKMPRDKGRCPHGEFILADGCPQCIAERQLEEGKTGQFQGEDTATTGRLSLWEEPDEATVGELQTNKEETAPVNTHQPYRLQDGSIVPGVTTVLNVLDKGGLNHWCWEMGRQGLDYREVRDAAARVGTLAHNFIACHFKAWAPNTAGYSSEEVDKAKKCFEKYLAWEKENPLSPVIIESSFVSELFKYGGTPDLLAEIDGEFVLIDFKTGGGVYDSYFTQLAGYRQLLIEQGWPIAGARVVRISPDDSEVEVAIGLDLDRDWQIFQFALGIYTLRGGAN